MLQPGRQCACLFFSPKSVSGSTERQSHCEEVSYMEKEKSSGLFLQRPKHPFRLVPGFLVFALGVGVGDDAAADGKLDPALADGEGADEEARVHTAVEADVTEAAAVGAARRLLELGDDFHGANLGGAGDGAAGES